MADSSQRGLAAELEAIIRDEAAQLRKGLALGLERQESHLLNLERSHAELSEEVRRLRLGMAGQSKRQAPHIPNPWESALVPSCRPSAWTGYSRRTVSSRACSPGPVGEGVKFQDSEDDTEEITSKRLLMREKSIAREMKRVQWSVDKMHKVQDSGEQEEPSLRSSTHGYNPIGWLKASLITPIHPNSRLRVNWDLLLLLLLLYVCITAPVLVCFDISLGPGDKLWYFETFVTVMFVLDILLNFNTSYFDADDKLVTSRWRIARMYCLTWLIIDLLAVIPFDLLPSGDDVTELEGVQLAKGLRLAKFTRILRVLRVVKLLRLLKVFKLPELMKRMPSFSGTNIMRLIIVVGGAILMLHLTACGFYYVAHLKRQDNQFELYEHEKWNAEPSEGGWTTEEKEELEKNTWQGTWVGDSGLTESGSTASRYITALYWAMSTLTTVGYGDVTPQNDTERLVSMFAMVIGVTVFAYFMGSTASLISAGNSTEAAVAQKLGHMREFLNVRRVPPMLREKIQRFYTTAARHQVLQEDDVIKHLSAPLRTELMLFLYRNTLEKVPFFQGQEHDFLTALVGKLSLEYYAEGDVVVAEGDFGNVMYFVVTGQLEGRQYSAHKSEWVMKIKQQSMGRANQEERENLLTKMKSGFGLERKAKDDEDDEPEATADQWRFFPNAKALGDDYKVVSTLHQGQHFGEYGCLLGQPRSATIVALEFCELYSLTRDDLMECYQQWPKLHEQFLDVVRQFEELLDCETPRPERDPDGSSDGQAADTERPPSPPLIHLPKDGDGDTSPSTNARPDSEVGRPSHDTAASSSDSRKGKAAEGSRLQNNGRRGSAAGMHKAAKLVMNMQHLDQKASKNPVFQLLNDGNDLKGMIEKQSSGKHVAHPNRQPSTDTVVHPQASIPGAIDPEIGIASET